MGLIKPFVFGFVIVTIACHVGLRTTGGTQGVGKATTIAVVAGSVAVIAADFFVTQILVGCCTDGDRRAQQVAADSGRARRAGRRVRQGAAGLRREGRAQGRQLHR